MDPYLAKSIQYSPNGKFLLGARYPSLFAVKPDKGEKVHWIDVDSPRLIGCLKPFQDNDRFLVLESSPAHTAIYGEVRDSRGNRVSDVLGEKRHSIKRLVA